MMLSKSLGYSGTMKDMTRPIKPPPEKFPKHTVKSHNKTVDLSGITYSEEPRENRTESQAEFEVLKTILNREGYLNRLQQVVRTVGKKFKAEVADILDLVRAASLDVIDMIVRWREIKEDHDAAFLWNGVNYVLKMSSDLDYLSEYLAVKRWLGFDIVRNPFCIPFPLDKGLTTFSESAANPKNLEQGLMTDGFVIGGLSKARMRRTYIAPGGETPAQSRSGSLLGPVTPGTDSPYNMGKTRQTGRKEAPGLLQGARPSGTQTFILNADMGRIRQAERVILAEEQKFGPLSRDPEGRLMPQIQAHTRRAAVELRKDDKRSLAEPATTFDFAPHAAKSDVGITEAQWTPNLTASGQPVSGEAVPMAEMEGGHTQTAVQFDKTVQPLQRGEGKSGGRLRPLEVRGADSSGKRPLKTTLGGDIEFKRHRHIRTLSAKLDHINSLRADIEREAQKRARENKKALSPSRKTMRKTATGKQSWLTQKLATEASTTPRGTGHPSSPAADALREYFPVTAGQVADTRESHSGGTVDAVVRSPTAPYSKTLGSSPAQSPINSPAASPLSSRKGLKPRSFKGPPPPPADYSPTGRRSRTSSVGGSEQVEAPVAVALTMEEKRTLHRYRQEEIETNQRLHHFVRDEAKITALKSVERSTKSSERSREIERKRRLLLPEEGARLGPPPEDELNVYDYYAIRVQSTIRGWLARCWVRWYLGVCTDAALLLQSVLRGWFGRLRVRRMREQRAAATSIQKVFRGWRTRGTSAEQAKAQNLGKAAVTIQRVWRGILGVRRTISKRALDRAAKDAFDSVNANVVDVEHVKELARRILYAIEEPTTTAFPPDEVLHLIRLTVMVIQSARGNLGLADYDFFNLRDYNEVSGEKLTWLQAAKMVNRSERFMRLVRTMAYGPGAKPPRLVQLPNNANLLYAAQSQNPRWCLTTFLEMGMGSTLCVQLFKWLSSIVEIAGRQQEFLTLIATSFPDWLPKLFELQKGVRHQEFEIELNKKCSEVLQSFKARTADDELLQGVLEREMNLIKRASNDAKIRTKELLSEIETLKSDQSSREVFALASMEVRVAANHEELEEMQKSYQQTLRLSTHGDRAAAALLPELRHNLTNQRLKLTELEGQRKLLEIQVEANREKRKDPARLTPEIMVRIVSAGEARGAYIIAQVETQAMLLSAGVKHASDLPLHLLDLHAQLDSSEQEKRVAARKLYVQANEERQKHDEFLRRELTANELKEQKSKDRMMPTDEELQEERLEDEHQAQLERTKHLQYVPDKVLHSVPTRPRPVMIGLARDLPGYAKRRMFEEITNKLPGTFICLDTEENMGLDVPAIQSILDSGKNVILSLDHGLTRLTRNSFLQKLEMTSEALIPSPFVAIAIGDERNMRGGSGTGASYQGVDKHDLFLLLDGSLKANLESMHWAVDQMSNPEIRLAMQQRAAELVCSSPQLALVMECLFVLLSEQESFQTPDHKAAALSWRFTRSLLLEPQHIVRRMSCSLKGRASVYRTELVAKYVEHPLWPAQFEQSRAEDLLLHLVAFFVEQWLECERACQRGGGVPLQSLTKTSIRGIQSVTIVSESVDAEDLMLPKYPGGGWKTGANKLLLAALQDMRVLKTVRKIKGKLFHVGVYREAGNIFLEAYEAQSSDVHLVTVSLDQVPQLLVPNGFSKASGENIDPPHSPQEMYSRLANLLTFEKAKKGRDCREVLVCRRNHTFLRNVTRRISGHRVLLKCYEASLGELLFTAYLPEHCAQMTLLVGEKERLQLLKHADTAETREHEFVKAEDARPLLPFVLDRLRISPSTAMLAAKRDIDRNDGFRKRQGLMSTVLRQGFRLSARVQGGVGRILTRKVIVINHVSLILELRSSELTKLLEINLYEPRRRQTMRLRLSKFQRKVLLGGSITDDVYSWITQLRRRLRVDWREGHRIAFDFRLLRAVRRIAERKLLVTISAVDDTQLEVTLQDTEISKLFKATLTKEQVIQLSLYTPPLDKAKRTIGQRIAGAAVRSILQNMSEGDKATTREISPETHPDVFAQPLENVLANRDRLQHLANQLSVTLCLVKTDNPGSGYKTKRGPLKELEFVEDTERPSLPPLDLTLRYTDRLQPSTESPDAPFDVFRARRQRKVLYMEEALNEMVLRKAQEADALVQQSTYAANQVVEYLDNLFETQKQEEAIVEATKAVTGDLLQNIFEHTVDRMRERNAPGQHQEKHQEQEQMLAEERKLAEEAEQKRMETLVETPEMEEQRAIVGTDWVTVFEAGVKVNYREGKVRWLGHVGVRVQETQCWLGEEGLGRRLKFIVYEPSVAAHFEGIIRSKKHLREVLGLLGQDLLDSRKSKEMLMFVCKNRLDVVVNKVTWDGEPVEEGAPPFRIEFQSDRLFGSDKVTPANEADEKFEDANKDKLIDISNARGKKIVRLVRRVSGLLMQFTVFELPPAVAQASYHKLKNPPPPPKPTTSPIEELQDQSPEAKEGGAGESAKHPLAPIGEAAPGDEDEESPEIEGPARPQDAKGYAEERVTTQVVHRFPPPAFRVVGYEPLSRRKLMLPLEPQAIVEVAGGVFSPYLHPDKRRELCNVIADAITLYFPAGEPYELLLPWSGAKVEVSTATVTDATKVGTRSNAERVLKRPGRLFRCAMRISKYELLVSLYEHVLHHEVSGVEREGEEDEAANVTRKLIFNFYSPAVSEAAEVVVTEEEQVARIGATIRSFSEGSIRTAAIRRFCRFFGAEILEDVLDPTQKTLLMTLLPPKKDFITDYQQLSKPQPGENIRPVGYPGVFYPLDACGRLLLRQGMTLRNRDPKLPERDFLVTVYTKSEVEQPERGLVIKLYDRNVSETAILHVGASEVMRLCDHFDEPQLLSDLVTAKEAEGAAEFADGLESGFSTFTQKGRLESKTKKLEVQLVTLVLADLGVAISPENKVIPYFRSGPRGILPS